MFFETGRVDLKSTYKEFYEKYKTLIGSATAQQVLNKNDEAWRSFLSLLKLKKGEEATTIHKQNQPTRLPEEGGQEGAVGRPQKRPVQS